MIDFLYELSRRIRAAYDLPEIKLLGKPLAPGPEGPYPPMISVPTDSVKDIKVSIEENQAIIDRAIQKAYEKNPQLFYINAEEQRRMIRSLDAKAIVTVTKEQILDETYALLSPWLNLVAEVNDRLNVMCDVVYPYPEEKNRILDYINKGYKHK